jgi:hypothetical protein
LKSFGTIEKTVSVYIGDPEHGSIHVDDEVNLIFCPEKRVHLNFQRVALIIEDTKTEPRT